MAACSPSTETFVPKIQFLGWGIIQITKIVAQNVDLLQATEVSPQKGPK